MHYFVNSGVYHGFGSHVYDVERVKGHPLLPAKDFNERVNQEKISYIWGQTCDGHDWLSQNQLFPMMNQGEWILYRNIGAYNSDLECRFNSFELPSTHYTD